MTKKKKTKIEKGLFSTIFHIRRGTNEEMPEEWLGAFVTCFAIAPNHEMAIKNIGLDLIAKGYEIVDISEEIHQLDPYKWNIFLEKFWPDLIAHFPTQAKIIETLSRDFIFYSPHSGYNRE